MSRLYRVLSELEKKCKMTFYEPAKVKKLLEWSELYNLLLISNGLEINVPGTVIYEADRMTIEKEKITIGYLNFGDQLMVLKTGELLQMNHETDEEYLRWNSICEFLEEELQNIGGVSI